MLVGQQSPRIRDVGWWSERTKSPARREPRSKEEENHGLWGKGPSGCLWVPSQCYIIGPFSGGVQLPIADVTVEFGRDFSFILLSRSNLSPTSSRVLLGLVLF